MGKIKPFEITQQEVAQWQHEVRQILCLQTIEGRRLALWGYCSGKLQVEHGDTILYEGFDLNVACQAFNAVVYPPMELGARIGDAVTEPEDLRVQSEQNKHQL